MTGGGDATLRYYRSLLQEVDDEQEIPLFTHQLGPDEEALLRGWRYTLAEAKKPLEIESLWQSQSHVHSGEQKPSSVSWQQHSQSTSLMSSSAMQPSRRPLSG